VNISPFRLAVKLMIDQAILGEASSNEEFDEYLTEYEQDWYLGLEKDAEWKEAIFEGKSNLLSLGNNAIKVRRLIGASVIGSLEMTASLGKMLLYVQQHTHLRTAHALWKWQCQSGMV
jgi:hypothetical protein